jgi:hypothetical protein
MKNLFIALACLFSFNAFAQREYFSQYAEGMWGCEDCLDILNIRHTEEGTPIVEFFTGFNGKLQQANILENSLNKLVIELYTPSTNWYVKILFYFEDNLLKADLSGSIKMIETYKRITIN